MHPNLFPSFRFSPLAALCAVVVLFSSGPLVAATLKVPSQYPSIQAAVTAASPGDNIVVSPGTWVEQVVIPAGKDKLTLKSEKPLQAIIKAPPVMVGIKAIVQVDGAQNVKIQAFTIAGPGGGNPDSIEFGVFVGNNGSATIQQNHITDIRDNPLGGTQNGIGVGIGRASTGQVGTGTVQNNMIDNYQKGGVEVSGIGSSAKIQNNTVTGAGPTTAIAQNGIQVSDGATAQVSNNDVSGNAYTPQTVASATGILLFNPGAVTVENNDVSADDVNIFVQGATATQSAPVTVRNNHTSGAVTLDGIDLYTSTGVEISNNTSENNAADGIFVNSDTSNNLLKNNKLTNNGAFDAQDNSVGAGTCGTANTWQNNKCQTDNRGGCLCHNGGGQNASTADAVGADDTAMRNTAVAAPNPAGPASARKVQPFR
ncbi:MAG: right-handed parallel beta-helix repeat-containing protein [Verrucomicrobia bacterium]|nr:right-handed parallel beta-helix repeat-containing protein [Verrucomicrobiota bacterium]